MSILFVYNRKRLEHGLEKNLHLSEKYQANFLNVKFNFLANRKRPIAKNNIPVINRRTLPDCMGYGL